VISTLVGNFLIGFLVAVMLLARHNLEGGAYIQRFVTFRVVGAIFDLLMRAEIDVLLFKLN
jgi:hypothetical protein